MSNVIYRQQKKQARLVTPGDRAINKGGVEVWALEQVPDGRILVQGQHGFRWFENQNDLKKKA